MDIVSTKSYKKLNPITTKNNQKQSNVHETMLGLFIDTVIVDRIFDLFRKKTM